MNNAGVNYKDIKSKYLEKPEVKREYEALNLRYSVVKALAKLRKDNKLTQNQLAVQIGTTKSVISRIEHGNQNVSVDMVEKIAGVFGKTIELKFK